MISRKNLDFFEQVYWVVRQIPYGRVTTYGAIASFLGAPGAARMVGWALNASHGKDEFVPAYRVVNRKGLLTGKHHFAGVNVMREFLESEGVIVEDDQVSKLSEFFWDPSQEIKDF